MVDDNDAGGVATYTHAGHNCGTHLLGTLLLVPRAWPGSARRGSHDLNATGVCLPNGCPPFTYWP
jgi:hypothetical protein